MTPSARLLSFVFLAATVGCSAPLAVDVEPDAFQQNIAWLADDARGGRQTGTPGLEATAEYVRAAFEEAGLEPVPGRDWYQAFEAAGGRKLLPGNSLELAGEAQELEVDFVTLPSALSGEVDAELVFAGYGITDPDRDWDDYADIDAEGKLVVVLRHGPGASLDEDAPLRKRFYEGSGRSHQSLIRKVNNAYKHGAAGLLIVNDPASHPIGSEDDVVGAFRRGGMGGAPASLPAAQVSAQAGAALMSAASQNLKTLQDALDGSGRPHSFDLVGVGAKLKVATAREMVPTMNVVGYLQGSDPALRHEHVVVGAHMDHVGLGKNGGSRATGDTVGTIHNGADDNASGTSGLIEIAKALGGAEERPARSVVFMAFGAEEWGLLGSRHYCEEPWLPLDDCVGMVNMDMIGRSGGKVEIQGLGSAAELRGLVEELNEVAALEMNLGDDVPPNTDHAPFYEKGVPILSFFTGLHDDYHAPGDDTEKIDAEGGARIASMAGNAVVALAQLPSRYAYTKYEPPPPPGTAADPHNGQEVVGYGVSFGSQPDMTYSGDDGVRISGVRAKSPAENCGLQGGDVIIALDGKSIRNLEDYSVLLFSHRPGDEITVTVRRGEEELELKAVLEGKTRDS